MTNAQGQQRNMSIKTYFVDTYLGYVRRVNIPRNAKAQFIVRKSGVSHYKNLQFRFQRFLSVNLLVVFFEELSQNPHV